MLRMVIVMLFLYSQGSMAQALIFAYGPGNGPPFAIINQGQLSGGLFKDMGDALARHAGLEVSYRQVPTKRASSLLMSGEVNSLCMTHPDWIEDHNQLFWSQIIAHDYDHVMSLKRRQLSINAYKDLHGLTIGTMTGYIYFPRLMQRFTQGTVARRDYNSLQSLYSSLLANRLDGAVDSLISINYRKKTQAKYQQLQVSNLVVYQYDLYCAFNVSLLGVRKKIEHGVQLMLDEGEFKQIINRYK